MLWGWGQVNDEDVNAAVAVMLRSFIATQKQAVQRPLQKKFHKYTSFQARATPPMPRCPIAVPTDDPRSLLD